jgi:hypothetical protein
MQPNTALWLTTIPTETRYRLNDAEMENAIRLRLHLGACEFGRDANVRTHICPCGNGDLLTDPLHFHSCAKLKRTAITTRHDLVLHELAELTRELHLPHKVEPRAYEIAGVNANNSRKRPDLTIVTAYGKVRELLTDVAIVNPAADSHVSTGSADRALNAARSKETAKHSKYSHLEQLGIREFKGFAMEIFGAFGVEADNTLKLLFKHMDPTLVNDSPRLYEARIRLSFALQRGNACVARKGIEQLCSAWDVISHPPHRALELRRRDGIIVPPVCNHVCNGWQTELIEVF